MVSAIRAIRVTYFRVHDSGDMFNVAYAECWLEVMRQLPDVKFWIPTRAYQQQGDQFQIYDPLLNVLREMAKLPNATVRPSALDFHASAPIVAGLHAGSSAGDDSALFQCPAYDNGGECGPCRHCWDDKTVPVNYPIH
jgi:hypothetical protein